MRHPLLATLLAAALCLTSAPAARAQDTPVVFVHGLIGDAVTWSEAARRLQARLAIEPLVPTLPWTETYETQAGRLQSAHGGLPSQTVAIGHSNGGIVSREWSRSHAVSGIVTVGTPHAGAPIVGNALSLIGFNQTLYSYAGLAWGAFGGGGFDSVFVYVQAALLLSGSISANTVAGVTTLLGLQASVPVAYQMAPGSPFLSGLNGSSNLSRESSAIRSRVGLTYTARNYWMMGPARAISPDSADGWYRDMWTAIGTLELAGQYLQAVYPPWNGTAMLIAHNLLRVASALRMVDPYWCWAVTNDWSCSTPHDGVVPVWSQAYPGGVSVSLSGPAHVQESRQSDEALVQTLTSRMGIPARGAVPPSFPPASSANSLDADEALWPGERLVSQDGRFQLEYQGDGNLVLYRMADGAPLWSTGTGASPGQLLMQLDGNLVLYAADGTPVWSTGTVDYPGARLELQTDGNLVLYSYNGAPLWSSGTAQ